MEEIGGLGIEKHMGRRSERQTQKRKPRIAKRNDSDCDILPRHLCVLMLMNWFRCVQGYLVWNSVTYLQLY